MKDLFKIKTVLTGSLLFDTPRHRTIWSMPLEYPRVNGLPEWYVVEPGHAYLITDLDTGKASLHSGQELAEGLPVALRGSASRQLRLTVVQQQD